MLFAVLLVFIYFGTLFAILKTKQKHQKTKVMKTKATTHNYFPAERLSEITIWILGILVLAFLFASLNASAITFNFEDETYIDDIPFNTEMIVHEMNLVSFNFEGEAYIDDIPFNTETISSVYAYSNNFSVSFDLEEESFINDIPFSTTEVVSEYNYQIAFNNIFEMPEEIFVEDIPFNTCLVVSELNQHSEGEWIVCLKN